MFKKCFCPAMDSFCLGQACCGRVAQSVERPKGPTLVQLYRTDVGWNPGRQHWSQESIVDEKQLATPSV